MTASVFEGSDCFPEPCRDQLSNFLFGDVIFSRMSCSWRQRSSFAELSCVGKRNINATLTAQQFSIDGMHPPSVPW